MFKRAILLFFYFKEVNYMARTYEEALREAKFQCIISGGCNRIDGRTGKWVDTETGKELTLEEGLALAEVDEEYVKSLM